MSDPSTSSSTPPTTPGAQQTAAPQPSSPDGSRPPSGDRTELVARARVFLTAPQVRDEDFVAKRRFLAEKGLDDAEIDGLLRELPPQLPALPPRTYPQPPPSRLPDLLIGVARLLTWFAGGSAVLFLVYIRFILPRLTHTYQARHALQSHQRELLSNLTASLTALKEAQRDAFTVVPHSDHRQEESRFSACHTVEQAVVAAGSKDIRDVPERTLLRCVLEELAVEKRTPTVDQLWEALGTKLQASEAEGFEEYQESLWDALNTTPTFNQQTLEDGSTVWSLIPPAPLSPSPVAASLDALRAALPPPSPPSDSKVATTTSPSRFQHTLQALTDFTGYLTTQAYSLSPLRSAPGFSGFDTKLGPEAEEVRREIRALKGLVLNRRTFMSSSPAPPFSVQKLVS